MSANDKGAVHGSPGIYLTSTVRAIGPRQVATMEQGRSAVTLLTGAPTGMSPLGRSRRKCKDNINWILKK